MTKEQFEREKRYQASLAVARFMLEQGIINQVDFEQIECKLRVKFQPVLGGIIL